MEIERDTNVYLCIPEPLVSGLTSCLDKVLGEGLRIGLGIVVVHRTTPGPQSMCLVIVDRYRPLAL